MIDQYIENVKMGQTIKGSYIFKIYSLYREPENIDDLLDEPFCRQVITRLDLSMRILFDFIKDFKSSNIQNLIENGLNSSFCNTIIDLTGDQNNNDIEVKLEPSLDKPFKKQLIKKHVFTKEHVPIIKRTANLLQKHEDNWRNVSVVGYVASLKKKKRQQETSTIMIKNTDNNIEYKDIKYNPTKIENDLAIESFKESALLLIEGDIEKTGQNSYELKNVTKFLRYIEKN